MASWIAKPWIEQALRSPDSKSLPKIARAQVIKVLNTIISLTFFDLSICADYMG